MTKQPYHDNSLQMNLQSVFSSAEVRQACVFVYDMLNELYADYAPLYLRNTPDDVEGFRNINLLSPEGGLNQDLNEDGIGALRAGEMAIHFQKSLHLFHYNCYEACLAILSEDVMRFFEEELSESELESAIIRSLIEHAPRRGITVLRQSGTSSGVGLREIADAYRRL